MRANESCELCASTTNFPFNASPKRRVDSSGRRSTYFHPPPVCKPPSERQQQLPMASRVLSSLSSVTPRRAVAAASFAQRRLASTAATTKTQSHQITSRLLENVHPLHLFRIVQDVDRYQDFLPLCSHSQVFPETIREGGRFFEAELAVGLGPMGIFQTRYRSKVSVDPEQLTIATQSGRSSSAKDNSNSNDGSMFESLTSSWKLRPVVVPTRGDNDNDSDGDGDDGDGDDAVSTSVDFRVEMTVSDPMVVAVLNQVLENVAETQVQAFYERCLALPKPTPQELLWAERFYDTQNRSSN